MTSRREFELYLMSLMRGQSAIESALASLDLGRDAFNENALRTSASLGFLDMIVKRVGDYVRVLGVPVETTSEPGIDKASSFAGSRRYRFRLELWPTLDLILREHCEGWVWGPELVRAREQHPPATGEMIDLRPWTIVASEVVDRFGAPKCNDAWNLGREMTYIVAEEGALVEIMLVFDLELLQSVDRAGVSSSVP
jgi:hypothetical protein